MRIKRCPRWDSNPTLPKYTSEALSPHQPARNPNSEQNASQVRNIRRQGTWWHVAGDHCRQSRYISSHPSFLSYLAIPRCVIMKLSSFRALWTANLLASIRSLTGSSLSVWCWQKAGDGVSFISAASKPISLTQMLKQTFIDVSVGLYHCACVRTCMRLLTVRINEGALPTWWPVFMQFIHMDRRALIFLCIQISSRRCRSFSSLNPTVPSSTMSSVPARFPLPPTSQHP